MILDVPEIDWLVTTVYEDAWAERMLDEFLPPSQNIKNPEIKLPSGKYVVFEGLGAAVSALAIVIAVAALVQFLQTYTTPKQRRRRHSEICVTRCMEILRGAKEDMESFHNQRALEADDTERRKTRNFKSRK